MELKHASDGTTRLPMRSFNRTLWNWNLLLRYAFHRDIPAFNRTLWNWNRVSVCSYFGPTSAFNRTLWNWNTSLPSTPSFQQILLIVPYGIETTFLLAEGGSEGLLIVPYGIETLCCLQQHVSPLALLIVPYGIETVIYTDGDFYSYAFNRTLWNWNMK